TSRPTYPKRFRLILLTFRTTLITTIHKAYQLYIAIAMLFLDNSMQIVLQYGADCMAMRYILVRNMHAIKPASSPTLNRM
ncbi:hypothetical protein, partial [Segatella oulorum]|uniref:hypothetical protein n=1 Tax=Segatella oulorum TaxID=28136 RepID=UPI0028E4AC92